MQIKDYLNKYQPIIETTFINALKTNHISHAYLLSGNNGMPLKECAKYLAKSLLCEHNNPLACEQCNTCKRIDKNEYSDVIIIDGEKEKIKKGDVEKIINDFSKTAIETKGIMIYVLHLVETMTPNAINSLLKFLEEPDNNVYAFLTTENESKILPTILSRTQILRFKSMPLKDVIDDAIAYGIPLEDAELLSSFYSDSISMKEALNTDAYKIAKKALYEQLDALTINPKEAIYICQSSIINQIKKYDVARLYLKMLAIAFKDILSISINEEIILKSYDKIIEKLSNKLNHIDKSLYVIMNSISKLDLNINIGLLLDHVIYEITKEAK